MRTIFIPKVYSLMLDQNLSFREHADVQRHLQRHWKSYSSLDSERKSSPFCSRHFCWVHSSSCLDRIAPLYAFLSGSYYNAIVISLIMSLAAAGGFLAPFFACVAAVYIGALSVAAFVITTGTIAATLIAAGWIGFFCTILLVTKKGVGVAKRSLSYTGSAISAYSSQRQALRDDEFDKVLN